MNEDNDKENSDHNAEKPAENPEGKHDERQKEKSQKSRLGLSSYTDPLKGLARHVFNGRDGRDDQAEQADEKPDEHVEKVFHDRNFILIATRRIAPIPLVVIFFPRASYLTKHDD
ncbi:hypothetical protein [Brytella acorum]|uniref:hypothetical protein n=1 Tax=Brytella acorum TaxID=2959299 RepID=UPI0025AE2F63|nr:hypothetical protein [Brytella acorum]MDF3624844.1 hypothetical protein [Brytella acorum]